MNSFYKSWIDKWDRIVVFAGIFDPIHKGHIAAAESALKMGRKVIFLPERMPQHKHGSTNYEHRLQMLKLATSNNKKFEVLDYPENQQFIEPVFTWLEELYPKSGFVWLVGSDVLPHMNKWPGVEKLQKLNVKEIVYIERNGYELENTFEITHSLYAHKLRLKRRWKTNISYPKINSSSIRSNFGELQNQIPKEVLAYAKERQLYH